MTINVLKYPAPGGGGAAESDYESRVKISARTVCRPLVAVIRIYRARNGIQNSVPPRPEKTKKKTITTRIGSFRLGLGLVLRYTKRNNNNNNNMARGNAESFRCTRVITRHDRWLKMFMRNKDPGATIMTNSTGTFVSERFWVIAGALAAVYCDRSRTLDDVRVE